MPIHDWSRVDPNLFHHFHQAWTITLCNALNRGLLPAGHSAVVERHDPEAVPDVVALRTQHENLAARGNRISIRRPLTRVLSVIEVVSPGNKASRSALRSFVEKSLAFLGRGIHLLVIDLFPPSAHDPEGIHKAIWDKVENQPFELPPDKPLTLAAYVAVPRTAYVEQIGVGDVLPDMPAFLAPDTYIPVPLEATYQATWTSCPEAMREAVEKGEPWSDEPEEPS